MGRPGPAPALECVLEGRRWRALRAPHAVAVDNGQWASAPTADWHVVHNQPEGKAVFGFRKATVEGWQYRDLGCGRHVSLGASLWHGGHVGSIWGPVLSRAPSRTLSWTPATSDPTSLCIMKGPPHRVSTPRTLILIFLWR